MSVEGCQWTGVSLGELSRTVNSNVCGTLVGLCLSVSSQQIDWTSAYISGGQSESAWMRVFNRYSHNLSHFCTVWNFSYQLVSESLFDFVWMKLLSPTARSSQQPVLLSLPLYSPPTIAPSTMIQCQGWPSSNRQRRTFRHRFSMDTVKDAPPKKQKQKTTVDRGAHLNPSLLKISGNRETLQLSGTQVSAHIARANTLKRS